mmetsp:Transcript_2499/g.4560  ORF Transcript_2499/g.4560 Transcript_2499/m.4560 type:complete len:243 (+) Transcript_2499:1967-2695(+)
MSGKVTEIRLTFQSFLVVSQIKGIHENAIEMKSFQQGSFSHETTQRSRPSLTDSLQPIQVNIRKQHFGQRRCFFHSFLFQVVRNLQIDRQIAIGIGQSGRSHFGCSNENTIALELSKENAHRFFNGQFVSLECNFWLEWFFVGIVNTREMFQFSRFDSRILSFWIALHEFIDWHVQEYFVKGNSLILVSFAHFISITSVGRNETHQCNDSRITKQRCQFSGTSDRFRTIGFAKSQISIQARS